MKRVRRDLVRLTVVAVVAAWSAPHASAQAGQFTITPNEGVPGTVITARSVTPCPPQAGENPRVRVLLFGQVTGGVLEGGTPVPAEGGPWELQLTVPADFPSGPKQIEASCITGPAGGSSSALNYGSLPFNVVAPSSGPPPPVSATPRLTG